MLLPSLSMVFDGSGPLVKQCDGFNGSLWPMMECHLMVIFLGFSFMATYDEIENTVFSIFKISRKCAGTK